MTQKEAVKQYMKDFGIISSYQAFEDLGITRLAAVVFELNKDGEPIRRKLESRKNRYGQTVYYMTYWLEES